MKKIVYPGSFDPFTLGHLDLVKRCSKLFDEVVILVSKNFKKTIFLTDEERVKLISDVVKDEKLNNVKVDLSNELTANYCQKNQINYLLRGIRNNSDLTTEEELNYFNRLLNNKIETIYLLSVNEYRLVSSSRVRELFHFGQVIESTLPKAVSKYLLSKLYQR